MRTGEKIDISFDDILYQVEQKIQKFGGNFKQSEIILLSEVGSRIYIKHKTQDFTSLNLIQFFCNKYSDLFNNSEFIEVSWGADDTQKIPAALLLSALGLPSNLFSHLDLPELSWSMGRNAD